MRKKLFLDTQSTGLKQNTTLISMGIVSECGSSFYAELSDYDNTQVDDWQQENVIDKLRMSKPSNDEEEYYQASRSEGNPKGTSLYDGYSVQFRGDREVLKVELERWLAQFEEVEIWGDCLAFDWVLFCEVFGSSSGVPNLPKNVLYIPFDICTLFRDKGIDPDVSRQSFSNLGNDLVKHNPLDDALLICACFLELQLI
ncbi:MAG: hypothetical protein AB8B69_09070 [Chitinophagales bacterium]